MMEGLRTQRRRRETEAAEGGGQRTVAALLQERELTGGRQRRRRCTRRATGAAGAVRRTPVEAFPEEVRARADEAFNAVPSAVAALEAALDAEDWAAIDQETETLFTKLIDVNGANDDAIFSVSDRVRADRIALVECGGLQRTLLRFFQPPLLSHTDARQTDERHLRTHNEIYNEVLVMLRELAYAVPSLVETQIPEDVIVTLFTFLHFARTFDNTTALLEELLAVRKDTFRLDLIPRFYPLLAGMSTRQLSHFSRVLALVLFEPEDRLIMESAHVMRSQELLQLRRERMGKCSSVIDRNQSLIINMPQMLPRFVAILNLLNFGPSLSELVRHNIVTPPATSLEMMYHIAGTSVPDWSHFEELQRVVADREASNSGRSTRQQRQQERQQQQHQQQQQQHHQDILDILAEMEDIDYEVEPVANAGMAAALTAAIATANIHEEGQDSENVGGDPDDSRTTSASSTASASTPSNASAEAEVRTRQQQVREDSMRSLLESVAPLYEAGNHGMVQPEQLMNIVGLIQRIGLEDGQPNIGNMFQNWHAVMMGDIAAIPPRTQRRRPTFAQALSELQMQALLLAPYQVEVLFVLCTLLSQRRKVDVQRRLGVLNISDTLLNMFERLGWGAAPLPGPNPLEQLHGPNCECTPESAVRVQFLRLVHNFCDRDFVNNGNKVLLMSNTELQAVASIRDTMQVVAQRRSAGILATWVGTATEGEHTPDTDTDADCKGHEGRQSASSLLPLPLTKVGGELVDDDFVWLEPLPRVTVFAHGGGDVKVGDTTATSSPATIAEAAAARLRAKLLHDPEALFDRVFPDSYEMLRETSEKMEQCRQQMYRRPTDAHTGLITRLMQVMSAEPSDSVYRFWLSSCMESYLRGNGPEQQLFLARRGLIRVLLGDILDPALRCAGNLQTSFDLLGELCKNNIVVLDLLHEHLPDAMFFRLMDSIMDHMVDGNVFLRSMYITLERHTEMWGKIMHHLSAGDAEDVKCAKAGGGHEAAVRHGPSTEWLDAQVIMNSRPGLLLARPPSAGARGKAKAKAKAKGGGTGAQPQERIGAHGTSDVALYGYLTQSWVQFDGDAIVPSADKVGSKIAARAAALIQDPELPVPSNPFAARAGPVPSAIAPTTAGQTRRSSRRGNRRGHRNGRNGNSRGEDRPAWSLFAPRNGAASARGEGSSSMASDSAASNRLLADVGTGLMQMMTAFLGPQARDHVTTRTLAAEDPVELRARAGPSAAAPSTDRHNADSEGRANHDIDSDDGSEEDSAGYYDAAATPATDGDDSLDEKDASSGKQQERQTQHVPAAAAAQAEGKGDAKDSDLDEKTPTPISDHLQNQRGGWAHNQDRKEQAEDDSAVDNDEEEVDGDGDGERDAQEYTGCVETSLEFVEHTQRPVGQLPVLQQVLNRQIATRLRVRVLREHYRIRLPRTGLELTEPSDQQPQPPIRADPRKPENATCGKTDWDDGADGTGRSKTCGADASPGLKRLVHFFVTNRLVLLHKLITSVNVQTVNHENICCLNTALLFMIFEHRRGGLAQLVRRLRDLPADKKLWLAHNAPDRKIVANGGDGIVSSATSTTAVTAAITGSPLSSASASADTTSADSSPSVTGLSTTTSDSVATKQHCCQDGSPVAGAAEAAGVASAPSRATEIDTAPEHADESRHQQLPSGAGARMTTVQHVRSSPAGKVSGSPDAKRVANAGVTDINEDKQDLKEHEELKLPETEEDLAGDPGPQTASDTVHTEEQHGSGPAPVAHTCGGGHGPSVNRRDTKDIGIIPGRTVAENFRELLWFWREYYLRRGRDRLSLEFSTKIHFCEWEEVAQLLCADDNSATSLLDEPIRLPVSPYLLPTRRSVQGRGLDFVDLGCP